MAGPHPGANGVSPLLYAFATLGTRLVPKGEVVLALRNGTWADIYVSISWPLRELDGFAGEELILAVVHLDWIGIELV